MFAMDQKPCFLLFCCVFFSVMFWVWICGCIFRILLVFISFFLPLTCYLPTTSIVPVILVRLPLLLTTVRHVRKGCHTRLNTVRVKKHHLVDVFWCVWCSGSIRVINTLRGGATRRTLLPMSKVTLLLSRHFVNGIRISFLVEVHTLGGFYSIFLARCFHNIK